MSSLVLKAQRQLRKIDNSKVFQGIVIAVILLSALLIGAKTHNLSSNRHSAAFLGINFLINATHAINDNTVPLLHIED